MRVLIPLILAGAVFAPFIFVQQASVKTGLSNLPEWTDDDRWNGLPRAIREGALTRHAYLRWLLTFPRDSHPLRWIHDDMQEARMGMALLAEWQIGEDEETAHEDARAWLKRYYGEDLKWLYEDNFWSFMFTSERMKWIDLCMEIRAIQSAYNRDEYFTRDKVESVSLEYLEDTKESIDYWRERAFQVGLSTSYLNLWAGERVNETIRHVGDLHAYVSNREMTRKFDIEAPFEDLGVPTTEWSSCYSR